MAAAEAKLSFNLAVDSVLDSSSSIYLSPWGKLSSQTAHYITKKQKQNIATVTTYTAPVATYMMTQ